MTTQKIIAIVGLILSLALPSALLAGSVNGSDWYSTERGQTTNQIEQVMPVDSAIAQSGIGMDWFDVDNVPLMEHAVGEPSFTADKVTGLGLDLYTKRTSPVGTGSQCLTLTANLDGYVNNC